MNDALEYDVIHLKVNKYIQIHDRNSDMIHHIY